MSDSPPEPYDQFTAIILQIFRANGQMLSWGDRFAAPFNLTSARWQMLGALAGAPRALSAPQLAVTMGVTRQGAQKQLDLLLHEEMVEKLANPYHKRSPIYRLSAAGKVLYQRIEQEWNQHASQMRQTFSAEELTTALHVLNRIRELHLLPEERDAP
ncbi:MAG: MarR family winged helix-turn-helix transcriptional regulator [Magnetococcus sp. DMHC-8]